MRATLFEPVKDLKNSFLGRLTETAILSQGLHSEFVDQIYYARWKNGEIDHCCIKPVW